MEWVEMIMRYGRGLTLLGTTLSKRSCIFRMEELEGQMLFCLELHFTCAAVSALSMLILRLTAKKLTLRFSASIFVVGTCPPLASSPDHSQIYLAAMEKNQEEG